MIALQMKKPALLNSWQETYRGLKGSH